jgi:hypothetical protein
MLFVYLTLQILNILPPIVKIDGSITNTIQPSSMTIPMFNGENYDLCSIKMKTLFCSQDLWKDLLFHKTLQLSMLVRKKELKENKQNDSKTLFFLQQAVEDGIFPRIMGATSAKDA